MSGSSRQRAPNPQHHSIVIDDEYEDEDDQQQQREAVSRETARQAARGRRGARSVIVMDEADERMIEAQRDAENEQFIDLTQDDDDDAVAVEQQDHGHHHPEQRRRRRALALALRIMARTPRNIDLHDTHRSVAACTVGGAKYEVGAFVEVGQPIGKWAIQFLEIKSIWTSRTCTGETILRGIPYTRTRNLGGRLENKSNEVCQMLEIDMDDARPAEKQAQIEIRPDQILTPRRLVKTNFVFPECRFANEPGWLSRSKIEREEQAALTCRWRYHVEFQDAHVRVKAQHGIKVWEADSGSLRHFAGHDVEEDEFRASDVDKRKSWRGRESESLQPGRHEQYAFGDMFCGAGGTSRGAAMAGFVPKLAVDIWAPACATYQENFPRADLHQRDMSEFIVDVPYDHRASRIDVLHLSPPCQPWSPANPNKGRAKSDEANIAALFACTDVTKKTRPLVATVEQTYGILHQDKVDYFHSLIQKFTCIGFSVQWKVFRLVQYGLPQTRRRLVMIASCPGSELPPWPAPTHSEYGRLKPYFTEYQALRIISPRDPLHDVHTAHRVNVAPRDPHRPFKGTLTCGGSQNARHYSGLRDFTMRELACLQGFPMKHTFAGRGKTILRKQIGNAFPPCVVNVFLGSVRQWLERTHGGDGFRSAFLAANIPRRYGRGGPSPLLSLSAPKVVRTAPAADRPGYQVYNGDLDEDEALMLALEESKTAARPRAGASGVSRPRRVAEKKSSIINLVDSDKEDEDEMLPRIIERLTFRAPAPSPNAIWTTTTSSTYIVDRGHASPTPPRDRSRSATLDFSPAPSKSPPPSLGKRKFRDDIITVDVHHDAPPSHELTGLAPKRPSKRERSARRTSDEGDDDVIITGVSTVARGGSERGGSEAFVVPSEGSGDLASGRALAFGKRIRKQPFWARSGDWMF